MGSQRTRPWRQPDGLANGLGLSATIIADWEGVQIQATDGTSRLASFVAASPTGVDMDRVACTMRANRIFDAITRRCMASRTARPSRGQSWATGWQQIDCRRIGGQSVFTSLDFLTPTRGQHHAATGGRIHSVPSAERRTADSDFNRFENAVESTAKVGCSRPLPTMAYPHTACRSRTNEATIPS
jgi:hypothetical protein